jgi:hypothetical protein
MVMIGTGGRLADAVRRYETAGLDLLHLLPVTTSPAAIDRLATDVLPAFESGGERS